MMVTRDSLWVTPPVGGLFQHVVHVGGERLACLPIIFKPVVTCLPYFELIPKQTDLYRAGVGISLLVTVVAVVPNKGHRADSARTLCAAPTVI